ncbi:hypothetical protein DFH09DRAFT_1285379 [Mycena vulgaris]|nr:hypothetical protein DFH09DRAFT_1285379 [Mycena vulgaris]
MHSRARNIEDELATSGLHPITSSPRSFNSPVQWGSDAERPPHAPPLPESQYSRPLRPSKSPGHFSGGRARFGLTIHILEFDRYPFTRNIEDELGRTFWEPKRSNSLFPRLFAGFGQKLGIGLGPGLMNIHNSAHLRVFGGEDHEYRHPIGHRWLTAR